jgi:hypothetical protein
MIASTFRNGPQSISKDLGDELELEVGKSNWSKVIQSISARDFGYENEQIRVHVGHYVVVLEKISCRLHHISTYNVPKVLVEMAREPIRARCSIPT